MSRWLLATMTTVLFFALVIAVTGFESLFSGLEVIRQPDATPYLGPAMVTGVAIVVFAGTAVGARSGSPAMSGLVCAATAYLVMLGVGSVGYALVHGDAAQLVVFPAGYALGPFVVGTVVIALVVVIAAVLLARHEDRRRQEGGPGLGTGRS
ncbi:MULTISPECIES: DUF6121 family protein [unclassified Curtobacterium]|uniref:DUF6121 family protein n=1 Tax=unclassified Curtobacterium TaxID=257496 RepID=UPI000DAA6523|nr:MULTISPECIES: DUF6121 family protein [unclassified Curtobacterium]PZE28150.1 hypothetical protein DEI86_06100 [Curtobacterium sp. MCBD17_028]PZF62237.1 hypothetical protein DEI92_01690 [Curtobacterium sp. MCBD17_034]PZM40056.1 hypothetical protein DEI90_04415 [Curtobacterium sp. MCBD17_031]